MTNISHDYSNIPNPNYDPNSPITGPSGAPKTPFNAPLQDTSSNVKPVSSNLVNLEYDTGQPVAEEGQTDADIINSLDPAVAERVKERIRVYIYENPNATPEEAHQALLNIVAEEKARG